MTNSVFTQKYSSNYAKTDKRRGVWAAFGLVQHADVQFLADNPGAGMTCDYVTAGMRKHPHEQHFVFYEHQDDTVIVVRVLHGSMDVELHLPKA
jgi:plasmid stabilization system protein ParE